LIVYIHSGYRQRGDKTIYSFLAEAYDKAGFAVIAINCMPCPKVVVFVRRVGFIGRRVHVRAAVVRHESRRSAPSPPLARPLCQHR